MRILAALRDNAANYYRVQCPFLTLHHQGLDVDIKHISADDATKYDVLWLQMHAEAVVDIIIREFKDAGKKVVCDVDDWLFELPPSWNSYNHFFERGTGAPNGRLRFHERALQFADLITCTTEYLADKIAQQFDTPVFVLPNCVMMGDWDTLPESYHEQDGPVLGWFGTANHWDDWREIVGAVDMALELTQGYLALMGAPEVLVCFPERLRARTLVTPLVAMRKFHDMRKLIRACDVGLAWATDTLEVSKCRSPLKVLQWGAAGVPIVASETVYGEVLQEKCFLTASLEAFEGQLVEALTQAKHQGAQLAKQWQEVVWKQHSYEMQSGRWIEALRKLEDMS